jgi:hypothetical protein
MSWLLNLGAWVLLQACKAALLCVFAGFCAAAVGQRLRG